MWVGNAARRLFLKRAPVAAAFSGTPEDFAEAKRSGEAAMTASEATLRGFLLSSTSEQGGSRMLRDLFKERGHDMNKPVSVIVTFEDGYIKIHGMEVYAQPPGCL
jgi:hypothetical protein